MDNWAEIRHLHKAEGLSARAIAVRLGVSRNTVAKALAADGPPKYVRTPVPTMFARFESEVRKLLKEFPTMPATVIGQRIGWNGSPGELRKRIALLRPEYAPTDPTDRVVYRPGEQVQCDLWFPNVRFVINGRTVTAPPVLVMWCGFSKFVMARMIPTRTTSDLLAGMWSILQEQLGAVPRTLVWDNEAGIGRRNKLADGVTGFCGMLATRIRQVKPYDPESKGGVERANKYIETSFLPGRVFRSPDDFNDQLQMWLATVANQRKVRLLQNVKPQDVVGEDRSHMLPLPPVTPILGSVISLRLPRDYYVRVHGNDYSVDPAFIGRLVEVSADLTVVTVKHGWKVVASHGRVWGAGQVVTDPQHVAAASVLRQLFQTPKPKPAVEEDLVRDLADYDKAFGIEPVWQVA